MAFLERLFERLGNAKIVQAIRGGLIMAIPVLLIGSFSLVLNSLPVPAYQEFITTFGHGFLSSFFTFIYNGTFGMLSVYMTFTVSLNFATVYAEKLSYPYGLPITAVACFAVSSGLLTEGFSVETLGVTGMFSAIFCALVSAALYLALQGRLRRRIRLYTEGADVDFNNALGSIAPSLAVIALFSVGNMLLSKAFHVSGMQELFIMATNALFQNQGRTLASALLFVFTSSFLWLFGIHGSDVLEHVSQDIFAAGMQMNIEAVAAGAQPTEIFTKTFFDVFVLMGGCGTTLCALCAILLFSRQRTSKRLAQMAAFPMLFNINELMVFGLPIVFNPVLFIPFLLTPLILLLVSFGAMQLGLVPIPIHQVEWTTPILLGGYVATGSLRGSVLQLINVALGTFLYLPFIRMTDRQGARSSNRRMERLMGVLQESERTGMPVVLTQRKDEAGTLSKALALDLEHALDSDEIVLYFQPQYDSQNRCIGAEALLRWKHPLFGMVYPPLVIRLADETGQLLKLEELVFTKAAALLPVLRGMTAPGFRLCVNVSATTLASDSFAAFLEGLCERYKVREGELCIEVTETAALLIGEKMKERFARLSALGCHIAIDDFSMGFTSLKYLQEGRFDLVKLDGSLVRDMEQNPRSREIIASIVYLSQSLGFSVLAEYVETEPQRQALEGIGCLQYQGYLYAKPMPEEELVELLSQAHGD